MSLEEAFEAIGEAKSLMKHYRDLGLPDDIPTAMKQIRKMLKLIRKLKRLEAELKIKEELSV